MTRAAARINQDEVVRLVKAVRSCGLDVSRVTFDGNRVDVIIGHSGDIIPLPVDQGAKVDGPIREPQL